MKHGRVAGTSGSLLRILLDVRHSLSYDALDQLTAAFDFSHQHRPLNHRDAVVGKLVLGHIGIESAGGFLSDEEGSDLCFHDFENETQILPDELVVIRDLVSDRAKGAPALH